MTVITAPDPLYNSDPALFLAGGITGCPEWQKDAIGMLEGTLTLYNPRRPDFDVTDPDATVRQIEWEHLALRSAVAILFWFEAVQVQPIALYELGAWSMTDKPLFIGAHPDYPRRQDVVVQTHFAREELFVFDTLEATCNEVKRWWS